MPAKSHFHHPEAGNAHTYLGFGIAPPPDTEIRNKTLRPGVYNLEYSRTIGHYITPQILKRDGIIDLPESTSEMILSEIDMFFTEEVRARYEKYCFLYRRGILMYGVPGTGKSVTVYKIIDKMIARGGIVLWNPDPDYVAPFMNQVHKIDAKIQVLVVWEEFDKYKNNTRVLQLLDGGAQINNVVYLATTNYIGRLPDRLKNRPSRFARVVEVGPPSAEARKMFLEARIHPDDLKDFDVQALVDKTEGWVIDHLSEVIKSHFVIGMPLGEAVANIAKMNGLNSTTDDEDDED